MHPPRFFAVVTAVFVLLVLTGTAPLTAQTGTVAGTVTDAGSGQPLSGAQISLQGTGLGSLSAQDGRFSVERVPAGVHTVQATLIGHGTVEREIRVGENQLLHLAVEMSQQTVDVAGITLVVERGDYVADNTMSATKTSTPLIETPQSVSVLTRQRIDVHAVETQAEALRYTPGVQAETFGTDLLLDWTQIRGFQQYGQNLFRDGLQFRSAGQSALRLNPWGAERIEVVRGPASVLYGQSSVGGLVNFVTKRPTAYPVRELRLQVGSFDRIQGAVDLGGRIAESDAWMFRLTGLYRDSEAMVDFSQNNQIFVAPALTWAPSDETTFTLLADFQRDDAIRGTSFLPAEGTLLPNPNGQIPVSRRDGEPAFDGIDRDQYSVGYLLDHEGGDAWTMRSRGRYAAMRNDYQISWGAGLRDDLRTLDRFWFSGDLALDLVTVDNHVEARASTGGIGHKLLFGVDFQRHVNEDPFDYGSAAPIDVFDPQYGQPLAAPFFQSDTRTEQRQIGLYLQDELAFGDGWHLVVSGRQDWVDSERLDRMADATNEHETSALTGRAGLLYRSEVGLAPYVSYAEGFIPIIGTGADGEPFDPERGRQTEVGMKWEPSGANAFLALAAFDLRRQNVLTANPDNPAQQIQTGEVQSRGIEVEGVATLLRGFDLTAALTWFDMEITSSNNGDEGQRPIIVPDWTGSAWAAYTFQQGALGGFGLATGVRHTGASWGDPANTLEVPAFTLFDAAVHYERGPIRLSVNADNVLDDLHVVSCYGQSSCFYGPTRTVRATLSYRW